MRLKTDRNKGMTRSESLRYWRAIHNKYSLFNGFNRQRRSAMVKKLKQRDKERNKMSIFFVFMFVVVFLLILLTEIIFIDERQGIFSSKKNSEFDPMGDIPDYFVDDRKLIGDLEIDSYRRHELSIKEKKMKDGGILRKSSGISHLTARISNVFKASSPEGKEEWMRAMGLARLHFYNNNDTSTDAVWMPIYQSTHKFFVYSAYFDDRKAKIVRIIGTTRTKKSDKAWCKFWYPDSAPVIVKGTVKIIRENWNLKYSACFIVCPLTYQREGNEAINPPGKVSVVVDPTSNATNMLTVKNLEVSKEAVKERFAVCIKPLHFDYNNVNQFIEFVELNKILGIEHFTLYNDTIGHQVNCILEMYRKKGMIRILPWNLNIQSQKEIRTEGLFAALNDCMYRYMYEYKYILMIDLDEYIIPHSNATIPELVQFLSRKVDANKVGALSFQNAFFYLQWPDDPNSVSLPSLITLKKTQRRQRFHPHKQRSKYIAVSPHVVEAGNHFVWEFVTGKGMLNVPNEVAFLHHYRVCEFGGDDCVRSPRTKDTTAYIYKDALVRAYEETFRMMSSSCDLE